MSGYTILDDVLAKNLKHNRKQSASQILGIMNNIEHVGHKRFKSKQFVPFTYERNLKGQIIKNQQENLLKQNIPKLSNKKLYIKNNSTPSLNRNTLIDNRFKFNQVNHFRDINPKSHLQTLSKFKNELNVFQNKEFQRNVRIKKDQQNFMSQMQKSIQFSINEQDQKDQILKRYASSFHVNPNKIQSRKNSMDTLQQQNKHQSISKKIKKNGINKLNVKGQQQNSVIGLRKPNKNPQLQQIQKHVKVHFNHPQLDKIKQSKRLTMKYLQMSQYTDGDKKFKQKVAEYKKIKQRIKDQLNKMV